MPAAAPAVRLYERAVADVAAAGVSAPFGRDLLLLVPYRSLSIQPFSFPFSGQSAIREAVKLQVQPFTSGRPLIEVFTTVRAKEGRGSGGIAWFLSSEELTAVESVAAKTRSLRIWPLPLALAARLPGDGIAVCVLKDAICSMLFEGGFPSLYRIIPKGRRSPEDEIEWIRAFARSRGAGDLATEVWEDSDDSDARARLSEMALETLSGCSFGAEVNLSLRAVDTVLALERGIRLCTRVAAWVCLVGLCAAGGAYSQQIFSQRALERIKNQGVALYRSVFDATGKIVDPVSQARGKLNAARGGEKGLILEEMLARLGASAKAAGETSVLVESLRYNAEGSDLLGSVPDMEKLQAFQKELSAVFRTQLGDIQQVPGGGLRFSMNLRW